VYVIVTSVTLRPTAPRCATPLFFATITGHALGMTLIGLKASPTYYCQVSITFSDGMLRLTLIYHSAKGFGTNVKIGKAAGVKVGLFDGSLHPEQLDFAE
jgi:hypothetical protein